MLSTSGWLSLAPPIIAIAVAFRTKRVLSALMAGILCATLILSSSQPYLAPVRALDYLIETLAAPDNLRLVMFSVLVGGLLKLIQDSGGFDAFALALRRWRGGYGKATVYSLTWIFGACLILETWSNVLINGVTMGLLYERLGISRARLAYFVHTIAINVVALVLVNSWAPSIWPSSRRAHRDGAGPRQAHQGSRYRTVRGAAPADFDADPSVQTPPQEEAKLFDAELVKSMDAKS
jgi:tetracycline resistance efflux pump